MTVSIARGPLTAVLGPTNTGKTHLAMERLLGHESGMIGFPLRLLARENYDRAVKKVGVGKVALVTGEEKIQPPGARYFMCTVESMPLERPVSFLAIDEVQMAADSDRGHIFTDRLLNARGLSETMVLGSDTMRPLLQKLVPGVEIVSRPRFSTLSYAGTKKLSRIPARSAVVGFSIQDVYAIAEQIRRQRGGAAVVLGALSPRTRNAQVEMFQAGEVDYLVATDAIGMGLNMDVNHVWFAGIRKFDGREQRQLRNDELAQIAGRAGRHMTNGQFGTTADVGGLEQGVVEAIENHRFDPVRGIQWRNAELSFNSVVALLASLDEPATLAGLSRAREADDQMALRDLAGRPDIAGVARGRERVRLLWEVCQVPDFRKTMTEEHTNLLAAIYGHLTGPRGRLPADWIEAHVQRLERFDGDIDTLMGRIAHTRTWTYIAHRAGWLDRPEHWQERASGIEERLSEQLHQRLTQRFVDRRTALLLRKLGLPEELMTGVAEDGEVTVEGEKLGRLEGFRFVPEIGKDEGEQRVILTAAMRALREVVPARVEAFTAAPDKELSLDSACRVIWNGGPVARLVAGADALSPKVEPVASDLIDGPQREAIRLRCATWIEGRIRGNLTDLMTARDAELSGAARGVVFQLGEQLGAMARAPAEEQISAMTEDDRKALARAGVRLGVYSVFIPTMLKPMAIQTRAQLWTIARGREEVPALPSAGRTSMVVTPEMDRDFLAALGYLPLGDRAIRADMVERLAWAARQAVRASRETSRKDNSQSDGKNTPAKTPSTLLFGDVVSEWMIAAAALGEDFGLTTPAAETTPAEAPEPAAAPATPGDEKPARRRGRHGGGPRPSREIDGAIPVALRFDSETRTWVEVAPPGRAAAIARETKKAVEPPKPLAGGKIDLPPLAPGHFRATAEMLSLVGCTEPEMANVLRSLGYRVHQPSEEAGPLHSFSIKSRFAREREEREARNEARRRDNPPRPRRDDRGPPREGAPADASGDAARPRGPRRDGPPREGQRRDGPRQDGPRQDGPRRDGPPREGAVADGQRRDGPRTDRPQGAGPAGGRPEQRRDGPRRDGPPRDRDRNGPPRDRDRRGPGGPEFRLVATTEKPAEAGDSPFAKLLELKLGKK